MKSFGILMRDIFGGETFMQEYKALTVEDKQDFYRLLREAGYEVSDPCAK